MATQKDANKAREEHSKYLQRNLGAHAIRVDKVKEKGKETFGVIAMYESVPDDLPETLEIETGGQKKEVPLRAEESQMAELE